MNRSVSVVAVVLVVLLCVAGLGVPTAMAGTGASDPSPERQSTAASPTETQPELQSPVIAQSQDFDKTTFEITVHENGSATWTIRHERQFDPENESEERRAFEEYAEEFESEETELYERFVNSSTAMAASGAEQTDREMEATNFRRSAEVDQPSGRRGIVELSFTWKGFARVDGGTVEVGDVFEDLYIAEDQAIEIEAGDGLTFDRIAPEDDAQYGRDSLENANSVRWSGEQQFLDGQPRAVFARDGSDGSAVTWQLAAGGLFVLAIGGGAVWYNRQRTDDTDDAGSDGTPPGAVGQAGDSGASATSAAAATATTDRDADETPSAGESEPDPEPEPVPDEELLTDEDRVVKLIRENGGRMKQVNIVEETGWSKSKVSMLLSDMEEDGTISKLRVGRENIISLDGFEPEATKSPFED